MSNSNGNLLNFLMSNGSKVHSFNKRRNSNEKKKKSVTTRKSKSLGNIYMSKSERIDPEVIDEVSFDSFLKSCSIGIADCKQKSPTPTVEDHQDDSSSQIQQEPKLKIGKSVSPKKVIKNLSLDYFSKFKYISSESESNSNDNLLTNDNSHSVEVVEILDDPETNENDTSKSNLIKSPLIKSKIKRGRKSNSDHSHNSKHSKNFSMETWCGFKQQNVHSIEIDLVECKETEASSMVNSDKVNNNIENKSESFCAIPNSQLNNSKSFTNPIINSDSDINSGNSLEEFQKSPKPALRRSLRKRETVSYSKVHVLGKESCTQKKRTSDKLSSIFDPSTWKKSQTEKQNKKRTLRNEKKGNSVNETTDQSMDIECILINDDRPTIDPKKRDFLMSGLPQIMKKQIENEQFTDQQFETPFPEMNHTTAFTPDDDIWLSSIPSLNVMLSCDPLNLHETCPDLNLQFLKYLDFTHKKIPYKKIPVENRIDHIEVIKSYSSSFPAKRFFKSLTERFNSKIFNEDKTIYNDPNNDRAQDQRNDPSLQEVSYPLWTEKYAPINTLGYLGNSNRVQKVKDWLQKWRIKTDRECRKLARQLAKEKRKKKQAEQPKEESSDDDFRLSDCDSDSESEQSQCDYEITQTMLITGPHGIGKTALASALANELDYKVFEVNASSRRSGKDILQQLLAAVESHHVAKDRLSSVFSTFEMTKNFQAAKTPKDCKSSRKRKLAADFFSPKAKRIKKDSSVSQPSVHQREKCDAKGLTLKSCSVVLFDEVDLVFEEDKGFWSAISTFMESNKRPIIMTSSDESFLDKFGLHDKIEHCSLTPSSPAYLASYLATVCLVEGYLVHPKYLEELAFRFKSDLRRCLNSLQFYLSHCHDKNEGFLFPSCLSMTEYPLRNYHTRFGCEFAQKLLLIRGSQRKLISKSENATELSNVDKNCSLTEVFNTENPEDSKSDQQRNDQEQLEDMDKISDDDLVDDSACGEVLGFLGSYYDSLSVLDVSRVELNPVYSVISPSCDESTFRRDCYTSHVSADLHRDLGNYWASCWENQFNRKEGEMKLLVDRNDLPPSQLWKFEMNHESQSSAKCRHQNNILKSMPLNLDVQKNVFTLDYLPAMRHIAHLEEVKKLSSRKRRYFHYFDKISLHLKESALDYLKKEISIPHHNSKS